MGSKLGCAATFMAVTLLGCSVHTQAPIQAVAYDFSDHDFYDRGYAPSPDYGVASDARDPWIEPAGREAPSAPGDDGAGSPDAPRPSWSPHPTSPTCSVRLLADPGEPPVTLLGAR